MIDRVCKEWVAARRAGLVLSLLAIGWAAQVGAYEAGPVADGGSISGTVKFKGTPPAPIKLDVNKDAEVCGAGGAKTSRELVVAADGGIQYAVVSIPGIAKGKPFPDAKTTLDQKGCEYMPHITVVQAGGEVEVLNSDGILHNIHSYPQDKKNPAVNVAQPKFKKTIVMKSDSLKEPERIKLACDVHGWMQGWLIVEDNPYLAITDQTGQFKLTDVPPGDYEITVWHEKLGEAKQKVTVKPGADTTANFELAGK
jgi:plastocyanin